MNEKPILFSTQMVRAILAGNKTQTRRVATRKGYDNEIQSQKYVCYEHSLDNKPLYNFHNNEPGHNHIKCGVGVWSKYAIGDILWVRETWKRDPVSGEPLYKADGALETAMQSVRPWRPSIHMPRSAARLFLQVTDVHAERLQNITREDCIAEGVQDTIGMSAPENEYAHGNTAIGNYRELWDSLNAKRGFGWDANPWVWVYEFEKIKMG
jgi:hypothetical protein